MGRTSAATGAGHLHGLLLDTAALDDVLLAVAQTALAHASSFDSAGVTLNRNGRLGPSAATDPLAAHLDELQYRVGEGPCREAALGGELRRIDDLATENRWPQFTSEACRHGVRAVFSLPLAVGERPLGSLNLYSRRRPVSFLDVERVDLLTLPAAVVVANAAAYQKMSQLVDQLNQAIESRDVIGQAKGVLMEREGIDADEAFAKLRRLSQSHNMKLRDVARRVADSAGLKP